MIERSRERRAPLAHSSKNFCFLLLIFVLRQSSWKFQASYDLKSVAAEVLEYGSGNRESNTYIVMLAVTLLPKGMLPAVWCDQFDSDRPVTGCQKFRL